LLKDNNFPKCPYSTQKTETPLKDWLLYIRLSINQSKGNFDSFKNFFAIVESYFELTKKQLVIVDQTNIFERLKKENKSQKLNQNL